jgi:hypothetical protein
MTIGGKGVIMRGMLRVILNGGEGSITVVRKPIGSLPPFGSLGKFFTPSVNDMV